MSRTGLMWLCLVLSVPARAGIVYDLVADWDPQNNPNGTWSFLQGSTPMQYQTSLDPLIGVQGYAPNPSTGKFLPVVWLSGNDVYVHSVDIYNGNPSLGEVLITWTAPVAGYVDISGFMYYGQNGLDRSNDYFLNLGSATLASGSIHYQAGVGTQPIVNFSFLGLHVTAGEVLSLMLQRTPGYPGYPSGTSPGTITAMDWTVNQTPFNDAPVPEPSTGVLLVAGLAATVRRNHLRRKRAA